MPIKRAYADFGDACRAANALDLVGDRWTLLLVRELILGPKRFADLQESVRGIGPAVLTERLRTLCDAGIVEPVELPDLARTRAYAATPWGRGLEPVLESLGRWFSSGPAPATSGGMTPDATVIAMRTMAPERPGPLPGIELRLRDDRRAHPPEHRYGVVTDGDVLAVTAGELPRAVATVTADSTLWSEVLFDGRPLDDAVRVTGERSAVDRLVAIYAPPVNCQ
ncbi:winged helix-turn-helix transcriptional regulator [Actinoplanes subglobosus]|uniref:Winged helix-turn-helix transcriptional regulator n=1 Tax=Actinoplanes subglobosus TaxID=1547892 RepID=A0ABV8IXJ0_9ACTN